MKSILASALLLAVCASGQPVEKRPAAAARVPADSHAALNNIKLDLRPFFPRPDFRQAMYISCREDGNCQAVNYSPNGLIVLAMSEGKLPSAVATSVLTKAALTLPQILLGQGALPGEGEGDPFTLSIETKDGTIKQCGGLVQHSSVAVRELVEAMVALRKGLPQIAAAPGYLRSQPMDAKLLARLRQAGTTRFTPIEQFERDLQPMLKVAVARPSDFFSCSQAEYQHLVGHGQQFFVLKEESANEIDLFGSPTEGVPDANQGKIK